MQDLVDTFLYYFEKGSAAERTITDEHVCQRIVKIAEELEGMAPTFEISSPY